MIRRLLLIPVLIWLLGFAWFALTLPQAAPPKKTDAIAVFTGGPQRIDRALTLLEDKQAQRLMITGVAKGVSARALARTYRRPVALFNCCVVLGFEAVDTRSNGAEIGRWVERRSYRSIRLVTTDWHMRRARFEVERNLPPGVTVISDAVPSRPSLGTLWREYHKLILRWFGWLVGV